RDVDGRFLAVAKTHASNLAKCRVRLLRRHRLDLETDTALLRAAIQNRRLALLFDRRASLADELVDRGHYSVFDSPVYLGATLHGRFWQRLDGVRPGMRAGEDTECNGESKSAAAPSGWEPRQTRP